MNVLNAGINGKASPTGEQVSWDDLALDPHWQAVIALLVPGTTPRAIQVAALRQYGILSSRRNLFVAAPTNSGKTLVAWLLLLQAIRRQRRALLIVPMRAIAREKADEITSVAPQLAAVLGCPFTVTVSTGDYALEDRSMADPPPDNGELVIATPERVESIFRNPRYASWLATIDAVCVDEAHLIGTAHRGPTLEHVVTSFLAMPAPPRIACFSATVGDTRKAEEWLAPCDVVRSTVRQPPLHKQVAVLDIGEDKNAAILEQAKCILGEPNTSLLVFVYQTRSAELLALALDGMQVAENQHSGGRRAAAYHAQMTAEARMSVLNAYRRGETRCIVTTTSLGLGVNLPATHVIVRDVTFPGVGRLSSADILQMMGRAGRGSQPGQALAFVAPSDGWAAQELVTALSNEQMNDFRSALEQQYVSFNTSLHEPAVPAVANIVVSLLARRGDNGASSDDLRAYLSHSLAGAAATHHLQPALAWLSDPFRVLSYRDDFGHYHLTVLGAAAAHTFLPLNLAAGFAQLIRDLLTIDPDDELLGRWQPLDTLITLLLIHDRNPHLRSYSAALADQVHGWVERRSEHASMLYNGWIRGTERASRADELLGSLGVDKAGARAAGIKSAHRTTVLAMMGSAVLYARSKGEGIEQVEREWKLHNLAGVESKWRDDLLWLLGGIQELLEVRVFYYHLLEHCGANPERIQRVKQTLQRMRFQVYQLRDELKYCSPLGSLLVSMRSVYANRSQATVGYATMRRLEEVGYNSTAELARATVDDLVKCGVKPKFARQIRAYFQRRTQ